MESFFMDSDYYEPSFTWDKIPDKDDWRLKVETNNMLVILTVQVPRR